MVIWLAAGGSLPPGPGAWAMGGGGRRGERGEMEVRVRERWRGRVGDGKRVKG